MRKVSELDNLCGPGKPLRAEPTDAQETENLVQAGKLQLRDAQNKSLAPESRFELAYNGGYAFSLAALLRMGYRVRPPAPACATTSPWLTWPKAICVLCAHLRPRKHVPAPMCGT